MKHLFFILFFALIFTSRQANAQWVIPNLYYDRYSAVLTPQSKATLDTLIIFLRDNKRFHLDIYSSTDSVEAWINDDLSLYRNDSIKAYFITAGIDSERLVAKDLAASRNVITTRSLWQNRRTEFRAWEDNSK